MPMVAESTPTTDKAMGPRRVLVCLGSESGTTRRLITRTIKYWATKGDAFECELMTGNVCAATVLKPRAGAARKNATFGCPCPIDF